jgi:glycosyltransferase involved in cell wall biosynthesis
MNVLHVITSMGRGGAEKLASDLLPKLKEKGCNVRLVSLTKNLAFAPKLKANDIDVDCLYFNGTIYDFGKIIKASRKLREIIKAEKPDIVHSHIYMADILTWIATPTGIKLISTVHGKDEWWSQTSRLRSVLKKNLDSVSGRISGKRYIAVSEYVRESIIKNFHISTSRVRTISNGIEVNSFHIGSMEKIVDKPVIIQVGRFYKEKGHIFSLQAFSILKKKVPGARLVFAGDGPLKSEIEKRSNDMGLGGSVQFLGARDDIPELLSSADIFWMPSLYEGLPIALLEAMACGVPVVAHAVGGLGALISNGENGMLVQSGDTMALAKSTLELLANPALRVKMRTNARRDIESKYSIARTADGYINAYEDLISGRW